MFDGVLPSQEETGVDQVPPEELRAIPLALIGPMTRTGERVSAVEVKTEALKEDTRVIRGAIHDINNNILKIFGVEQECSKSLALMAVQMSEAARLNAEHTAQIAALTKNISELNTLRAQGEGAWFATGKLALVLGAVATGIAAAVSVVYWIATHITLNP